MLTLGFDLQFADLYRREGLLKLDAAFVREIAAADAGLHARLVAARADPAALAPKVHSQLMIDLAPRLDDFLGALFGIREAIAALAAQHDALAPLYQVKRQFVQRAAAKAFNPGSAAALDGVALGLQLAAQMGVAPDAGPPFELAYARQVLQWHDDEERHAPEIAMAKQYAAWALYTPAGVQRHGKGLLFKVPANVEPMDLLHHAVDRHEGTGSDKSSFTTYTIKPEQIRRRSGFKLTDAGTDLAGALDQAQYCIWCHNQGKDSCSTGL